MAGYLRVARLYGPDHYVQEQAFTNDVPGENYVWPDEWRVALPAGVAGPGPVIGVYHHDGTAGGYNSRGIYRFDRTELLPG